MASFVPYYPAFADGVPDSYQRRSMDSAAAVASVARAHGCERADAGEVYSYMSTKRFKNPSTYALVEGHIRKD